ncbi:MAG: aconitate hydratase AcnA [Halobacteriovoraceae bacterium]|jgi:aconitate hydratase|nr:aconitate hydratase AcnA [Halobacteriovoraceae bacterium]
MSQKLNSFNSQTTLEVEGTEYEIFSLKQAEKNGLSNLSKLPKSLKVLAENLLRKEDGSTVSKSDIEAMNKWVDKKKSNNEINFYPARVMMQDFTGVPAVVDLAAMRDAIKNLGGDPQKINPQVPVDLVIDHSVMVDSYGNASSFQENVVLEFERNKERYEFLKWGQNAFQNFRVVPPGTGIIHQVNLEYTAQVVWTNDEEGKKTAYCDSLVGTDSHTTMINGLSVLGWGVGGIEAEAAMLGQAVTMLIPEVVGFKLTGKLTEGVTATDLVLRVVEMLRQKGVVGKFVEFYGDGLEHLSLADRATIANMAPEYGATMGFFPIDEETIRYLRFTNRDEERVKLVEAYAKEQGLWRNKGDAPEYTDTLELDMADVKAAISGPKRPQDRIELTNASSAFNKALTETFKVNEENLNNEIEVEGQDFSIKQGDVVIAAITSCTNTSNPYVMIGAGLVARKARAKGLKVKPWVKTSLAPGSQVVTDYLAACDLQKDLDALGFNLVGYGCTTCIGNSGPLKPEFSKAIAQGDLVATSVLSGNRNFEGRISPDVKANYLASPPLVVAYAIAGNMKIDIVNDALGKDKDGNDVYLKDIWPSTIEIEAEVQKSLTPEMFKKRYSNVFEGTKEWQEIQTSTGETYNWNDDSTYIQNPPYFEGMQVNTDQINDINSAKILAILADSTTTDHISPAGNIKPDSPAGKYLQDHGVGIKDFNSYGSRRGNDRVMTRGTFANIRIKNEMLDGVEGGYTKYDGKQMPIFDAAMEHKKDGVDLVVIAGKEYGTGSSRDWAAKGTRLQGVRAVIVESFERIHRSNLIGMGVLPLEFMDGENRKTLKLNGDEKISIKKINDLTPGGTLPCEIEYANGEKKTITLKSRIDTQNELNYFNNGGILHFVLRNLNK